MNAIESTKHYKERIKTEVDNTLIETNFPKGVKKTGKVRDQYELEDKIALITTDRQSAFDRVLASIPFKGQVLNLTSAFQDAYNVYSFQNTFGDDIRQFVGNTRIGERIGNRRLERQLGRAKRDADNILGRNS